MARSFFQQDTQIRNSQLYADTFAAGSTLESAQVALEDDMNALRSQVKRAFWADAVGKWYDDVTTVNAKKRAVNALNTDLNTVEVKPFLFREDKIANIVVPASVAASGSITAVAGANLIDGETFTISDGVHAAKVFEFDDNASVLPGHVAVTFTAGDSANTVAATMRVAINAAATLDVTAGGSNAVVSLLNDFGGTIGNVPVTETVADAGFLVAGMTSGAGDIVVLSAASSETPSIPAAVGAGTANGAVVALLTGDVGIHSLANVVGPDVLSPKNYCLIVDPLTGQPIQSSTRDVWALIQVESGTVNGDTFNDTNHQVQLSFVRDNVGHTGFEPVPAADIAGKTILYSYVRRIDFSSLPEYAFLAGNFADLVSGTSIDLNSAIDNQVGPATQTDRNIDWRISDTYLTEWSDSTGARQLLKLAPNVAGDAVSFSTDDFIVDNVNRGSFLNGVRFDSGGTGIDIGDTAGTIASLGKLDVKSASTFDLSLLSGQNLVFSDAYQAGSTYASNLKLAASSAEWSAFETAYGAELSILGAISQSKRRAKIYATVTANVNAGVDVGGVGGGVNLDAQLPDMSIGSFLLDYDVFVNGQIHRPGSNNLAGHDYYPGTSLLNGQLRFAFKLHTGDVIAVEPYVR